VPPRAKNDKKVKRGIIEEVSEQDRAQSMAEPKNTVYRKEGKIVDKETAQESKKEELQRLNNEQVL
jgi:hypothetical protein